MDALRRIGAFIALIGLAGCAGSPPPEASPGAVDETPWGDEYAGVDDDADMEAVLAGAGARPGGRTSASVHALFDPAADGADAPLRSLTASARSPHTAARFRRGGSGDAGAIELFDMGPLAHLVAGAIRPRVGEGAWLADARELGTPVALGASSVTALRVAPSSLRWGSVLGAGAAVEAGRARVSTAAWRPHDDDTTWTAWSGMEWRWARTVAGVAAGKTARTRPAVSLIVARANRSVFACVEAATTGARTVFAARVAAGDAWRAALASGGTAPPDTRPGSFARDRRMAVIERRDTWPALASRVTVSSVMQRAGPEYERYRRVDWRVRVGLDEGARVEGGVRLGERVASVAPSLLQPGERDAREEWRARLALVVREQPSPSLVLEHMFRVDAVHAGSAPGIGGTWRGTIRRGVLDVRAQASAWGLRPGQTAYLGRGGLAGSGAFTTASGSGSDLSLALRVRAWGHATAAAEWRRSGAGDEGVVFGMSLDW